MNFAIFRLLLNYLSILIYCLLSVKSAQIPCFNAVVDLIVGIHYGMYQDGLVLTYHFDAFSDNHKYGLSDLTTKH